MTRFPADFAELLSARGRRVLAGGEPGLNGSLGREPFVAIDGLFDPKLVREVPALLEHGFGPRMCEMNAPAPPSRASQLAHGEVLPKTGRMMTTPFDGVGDAALGHDDTGLAQMLRSPAYLALVQVLSGRPVRGPEAIQVLCYRPGDYAGPHTDHQPEDADVRAGYTDVHLTFCTGGVKRQLLVFERDAHLSQVASLSRSGALTAYRLPFWHYTTPLEGTAASRRWLVLGSFVDAGAPRAVSL
ncbi:MAG: hypothetical protein IPJ65_37810 [Archangiaceae bacterium]|nr:hypothetical protein [Archangiaceae bacterium]